MPDNIGPFRMPFYKCRNYQDCYLTTFNFDPSVGAFNLFVPRTRAFTNIYCDFHKEIKTSNYEEAQNDCRKINSSLQTYFVQVRNPNFSLLQHRNTYLVTLDRFK